MRPNNPSKRLRGRSRSKGGGNPLSRSYESNGPDVKIRGSALQVADKYAQLARDAQSSGDRVMAENYFQHAEHYYRIVAAAYEQSGQQQPRGDRRDEDRRDDRHRGNEQPSISGYDGMEDDDEGLRRAIRVNGNGHGNRDQDDDDEDDAPPPRRNGRRNGNGNGAHASNGNHAPSHHAAAHQHAADDDDDDDDSADAPQDLASAPQPDVTPAAEEPATVDASAETASAEDGEGEDSGDDAKPKKAAKPRTPRRRTATTPRTRAPRTRRTAAAADAGGDGAPAAAESGEPN